MYLGCKDQNDYHYNQHLEINLEINLGDKCTTLGSSVMATQRSPKPQLGVRLLGPLPVVAAAAVVDCRCTRGVLGDYVWVRYLWKYIYV